jgi:N-hydroxyarylamine O-acetyltransferase
MEAQATPTIPTLDDARTTAYLARLGVARASVAVDRAGLSDLHERHLRAIPFENLSIHLGEPIVLDVASLVDKLTVRGRGGFCYELNGAFAALLTTLGFDVAMYEARVGSDGGGMRFDHMCLRVRSGGHDHLADVGFGASFLRPLDLRTAAPQSDPAGTYQVMSAGDGEFDMLEDGEPQFRFTAVPRALPDFADACRFHQTSPASHFTQRTVCSLPTAAGRVTISGRTLIVTEHDRRSERVVESDDELLDLYRRYFGIVLDRPPQRTTHVREDHNP